MGCNIAEDDPWVTLEPLPLYTDIELQIDEILPRLTLEQKVGHDMSMISSAIFIKADTGTIVGLSNVRLE